jgi:hypothetical protein
MFQAAWAWIFMRLLLGVEAAGDVIQLCVGEMIVGERRNNYENLNELELMFNLLPPFVTHVRILMHSH